MTAPSLDLVAPGLLGPVPETVARAVGEVGELRALRRLLARARRRRCAPGTRDELAGNLLGAADPGVAGPLAAGLIADRAGGYWSMAAGCHLIADRDRLMVQAGPEQRLSTDEAEAIAARFNDSFAADGWALYTRDGALILRSDEPLPAGLVPLHELSGHYLDDFLPGGSEARRWRALLNELQMMLFEHPINRDRESQGRPPVNGLWFWGCGEAVDDMPRVADVIASDAPVLRGIAHLGKAATTPPVERLSQLDTAAGDTLAHWADAGDALATGDATAWLTALAGFEDQWAKELLTGLNNGSWGRVRLHVGPGEYREITRTRLRSFWRPVRPLARHLMVSRDGS